MEEPEAVTAKARLAAVLAAPPRRDRRFAAAGRTAPAIIVIAIVIIIVDAENRKNQPHSELTFPTSQKKNGRNNEKITKISSYLWDLLRNK
jgi:hypothetical protein